MLSHRVLIADGSATIRAVLRREFDASQFEVFEAADGLEAIRIASDVNPEIITLSLSLAKRKGLRVCKALTTGARDGGGGPSVIVITAGDADEDRTKCFEAGAIHFMQKGFQSGELAAYVDHILDQRCELAGTRVLVVDDNPFLRSTIARVLEADGADVVQADDGLTALEILGARQVDLIVTDHYMKKMHGISFVREVRALPEHATTPVLLCSAASERSIVISALEAGANDFIRKPFESAELLARVRTNAKLTALTRQIQEANAEAQRATETKSRFLANMSHEIRTPLTAILGFADVLAEEADPSNTPAEQLDAIDAIQRNGAHLFELVNDILDLSKIEAGRMKVERIPCSPFDIITDVAVAVGLRAESKGLTFDVEYTGPIPRTISTDPTRLRQILLNVVGNALKFTDAGGLRMVIGFGGADSANPYLQIDVVDTGIGMSPRQRDRLFAPFTQGDSSTSRRFEGTGLGLTISRHLAQALGGDVTLVKTQPGAGSTFRAVVATGPVADVPLVNAPIEPVRDRRRRDGANSSASIAIRLDARILLVEDGEYNIKLIEHILAKAGATVTTAENGQLGFDEAMSAWRAGTPYDVILMDMQMPVLDGYEATKRLRKAGYGDPILALTAHTMATDKAKCLEAGCDEYLTKPIDRAALLKTIHAHLRAVAPTS